MRARWLIPVLLAAFAGCLLPSYGVDPTDVDPDAVAGSSGMASSAAGTKGAGSSGASSSGGTEAEAGTSSAGTATVTEAGAPNMTGGCAETQKDCAGVCVELDDVKYGCTATSCNQSECPAGGETLTCEGGACVIATCPADKKKCDGRCVSVNDPTFGCGADSCEASNCPDPGPGTVVCNGTSCEVGTCSAQTKQCEKNCVPLDASNGCAEVGRCSACDTNETCSGTPPVCTCEADNAEACMGKACGSSVNNCGDVVECPDTCQAPSVCGGGKADANHCGYEVPRGSSTGCSKNPPSGNSAAYTIRNVSVTGVDAGFIAANPPAANGGYTWTARNYFIRLPANYDKTRAYPLILQGGGCGNTDGNSGASGGFGTLPSGQDSAIQVGLSYVYAQGKGACFQDNTALTPEVAYFDAVLADVQSNYCVDKGKVFADGYSSGAAEALLFGCARAGIVRATGSAPSLHRLDRPACAAAPVAAMMINGIDDNSYPISGPTGAAAQRDDILLRNGCNGSSTVPWNIQYPNCVMYSGCPAPYPVVWCEVPGGHTDGGTYSKEGFWKFFSDLPDPP